jgi:hypothetical protein
MTAFTGVEALLNSQPLTYQSADPFDNIPLTPNHFLYGQMGSQLAPEAVDIIQYNPKKRWHHVQELSIEHVWERWMKEFIPELNHRKKWRQEESDMKVGDVVMVADPDSVCGSWPLGRNPHRIFNPRRYP